ncbi:MULTISPECIES: DUF418 domain-containing protein [unclassified Sphingomonas]|uniref:DUF418 domain-containing protein n=1 Tax=unclassified Sphingomonas TaxID=196159 RepID=UPI00226A6D0B|nr:MULTISPECIES: DUF418 domain-containing protein [unclassified Sphingomonas]
MTARPLPLSQRIAALDVIRGVAVLGILAANIAAFGLPGPAYFSPAALGAPSRADLVAWALTFVLVEGKMRGLFTLLFGASMLLVIDRAEAAGDDPAKVHYARMAWLFVFGLVHLYLFWWGDILTHYALVGCIAYAFRHLRVRWLVLLAGAAFTLQTLEFAAIALDLFRRHAAVFAAHASPNAVADWQALASPFGRPTEAEVAREVAAARGSFGTLLAWRWSTNTDPFTFLPAGGMETLGYMLLGMAGLRSGFLSGAWTRRTYARIAVALLAMTVPLSIALAAFDRAWGFDPRAVFLAALPLATPLHVPMVLGYAALVMALARAGGWWTRRFAAAGRMAFTNYLGTTLVCTTIFYGYGLGLFDRLGRAQLYAAVVATWVVILAGSRPWLARYRYGPLEWLWRSLARLAWQPMRGANPMR